MINMLQNIFNRLSRARITSENSFGILTNRFEVFRSPMRISPEKAVVVTFASMTLHNWLIQMNENRNTRSYTTIIGNGILPLVNQNENEPLAAIQMRETIKLFVNNEGSRSWQLDKI